MISVSILNVNDNQNVLKFNNTTIKYIHLDVMDGYFVSNKTLPIDEDLKRLKGLNKKIDVHLMVNDIKQYVDRYKYLNPEYITFHLEATKDVNDIISYIKNLGIKVGISIKPNTPVESLIPYLNDIDLVLVMSVEPGQGGQKFMTSTIDRVLKLKKLREDNHFNYVIEVDGGINNETIKLVDADIFVVGSYITKSDDYQARIDEL